MEEKVKVPFYKKKWFIILVSVFIPFIGIIFIWKSTGKMNKALKVVLTAVVSLWSAILLAAGFGGGETETPEAKPETTQLVVEETTTHAYVESTTALAIIEEATTAENTTEITTEESTTTATTVKETTTQKETTTKKETTTQKETTTKKVTTTAKPTTTKKVTTTAKPTTTKKVTTTAKPTTTKKVTTTAKPSNGGSSATDADYIVNMNSGVFHYTWCGSAATMKESNKKYFYGSRQDAINKGYKPCGNCEP